MERTADTVILDCSAVPQVCAKVRAVGIEHRDSTRCCSKRDELLIEVVEWHGRARRKVIRPTDLVPAGGDMISGESPHSGLRISGWLPTRESRARQESCIIGGNPRTICLRR